MKETRFKVGQHTFTHLCPVDVEGKNPKLVVDQSTDDLLCAHCGLKPVYNQIEIHIKGDSISSPHVVVNQGPGAGASAQQINVQDMGLRERVTRSVGAMNEISRRQAIKPYLKG